MLHLREVFGYVQDVIEEAAQKDKYVEKLQNQSPTTLDLDVRNGCIFLSFYRQLVFRDQAFLPGNF